MQGNAFVIDLFKTFLSSKTYEGFEPNPPLIFPGAIASVFVLTLCSNPVNNAILAVFVKHVNRVQIYILCIYYASKW